MSRRVANTIVQSGEIGEISQIILLVAQSGKEVQFEQVITRIFNKSSH